MRKQHVRLLSIAQVALEITALTLAPLKDFAMVLHLCFREQGEGSASATPWLQKPVKEQSSIPVLTSQGKIRLGSHMRRIPAIKPEQVTGKAVATYCSNVIRFGTLLHCCATEQTVNPSIGSAFAMALSAEQLHRRHHCMQHCKYVNSSDPASAMALLMRRISLTEKLRCVPQSDPCLLTGISFATSQGLSLQSSVETHD